MPLHNHAGNIDYDTNNLKPIKEPLKEPCLRPFRDIAIFYNGDVALCCDDGGLDMKLGNLVTDSFMGVWDSDKLNSIRRNLLADKRIFKPCSRCDYIEGI